MSQDKTIGERIKEARMAFGMSQKEFAEKAGLSGSSISRIEKGEILPTKRTLMQLCMAHEIRRDWMEQGTGPVQVPIIDQDIHDIDRAVDGASKQKKRLMAAIANCDSEAVVSITKLFLDFITEPKNKPIAEALHVGAVGEEIKEACFRGEDVLLMYSKILSEPFSSRLYDFYFKNYCYKFVFSFTEEGGIEDEKKS